MVCEGVVDYEVLVLVLVLSSSGGWARAQTRAMLYAKRSVDDGGVGSE